VYSIFHAPQMNGMVNALLKQKKAGLERALCKDDWETYVFLHERPYRLDAFMKIRHDITRSQNYWTLLGHIWQDSENIWQHLDDWRLLFEEPERGYMEFFMDDDDRKAFSLPPQKGGMPATFPIYRGFNYDGGEDGFSWTIDRARAEWFARRFSDSDHQPLVAAGTVGRKDVIGYLTGRGEQEIVVLPENVYAIEIASVGGGD
jgi:hypothetical protein